MVGALFAELSDGFNYINFEFFWITLAAHDTSLCSPDCRLKGI